MSAIPAFAAGESIDNPVVCKTFAELKAALEDENITYVSIGNVEELLPVVDATDYLRIKGHFLKTYKLSGMGLHAGDVTFDGIIDATDYLRIKGHFLKTYNLYE